MTGLIPNPPACSNSAKRPKGTGETDAKFGAERKRRMDLRPKIRVETSKSVVSSAGLMTGWVNGSEVESVISPTSDKPVNY